MADEVLDPTPAIGVYTELLNDDRIDFAQEPPEVELTWTDLMCSAVANSNSWTDAYLAAFALNSELTIVSFDRA